MFNINLIFSVLFKLTLNQSVSIDLVEQNYDDNSFDNIDKEDVNGIIIEWGASVTTSNINIRHAVASYPVSKVRKVEKAF